MQQLSGDYQLAIGPHVQDVGGVNEMDQNGDQATGNPDDVFKTSLSVVPVGALPGPPTDVTPRLPGDDLASSYKRPLYFGGRT